MPWCTNLKRITSNEHEMEIFQRKRRWDFGGCCCGKEMFAAAVNATWSVPSHEIMRCCHFPTECCKQKNVMTKKISFRMMWIPCLKVWWKCCYHYQSFGTSASSCFGAVCNSLFLMRNHSLGRKSVSSCATKTTEQTRSDYFSWKGSTTII